MDLKNQFIFNQYFVQRQKEKSGKNLINITRLNITRRPRTPVRKIFLRHN